ncbi:MAG: hypothetical protein NWF01_05240 [Candidatus Bathyarchaeota archaeon]|nr:hypothetical protein [Candidatus Bathyarchaeota archaeon]
MIKTSFVLILLCCLLIVSAFVSLASANPVRTGRGDVDPAIIISVVMVPSLVGLFVLYLIRRRQT